MLKPEEFDTTPQGFAKKWQLTFENADAMLESITRYGLGGSSIALVGRVGGGIYTEATDMGADLSGTNGYGFEEDDERNPTCSTGNAGDNVGDIAGMSADLFGSFAEATCVALVLIASANDLQASMLQVKLREVCTATTGWEENSLLDCVVYGRVAGLHCTKYVLGGKVVPTSLAELSGGGHSCKCHSHRVRHNWKWSVNVHNFWEINSYDWTVQPRVREQRSRLHCLFCERKRCRGLFCDAGTGGCQGR